MKIIILQMSFMMLLCTIVAILEFKCIHKSLLRGINECGWNVLTT